jgi:drug/metabolite transporter superfamily protein YnfA
MKSLNSLILVALAMTMTSCEAIGDIFGAGVYTGIFIVIFVIVLLVVVISRIFRR